MKKIVSIAALLAFSTAFAQKGGDKKLDRSIRPKAAEAPVIKLGEIQSFELANGLKVFVVENHKQPTVAYSIALDIRPALEGEFTGTADMTGQLMTSGTKTRSKDQLDNDIDFIGATLNADPEGMYAAALKKQQTKLLELMSDVLLNPSFSAEELEKIKTQTLSGLAQELDDPDAISKNVKAVLNYGTKHPYGELTTEASVSKITTDNCRNYYNTYFHPNVAYMAVVGDVTLAEVKPLIEKYFGAWQKADVPRADFAMPQAPAQTRVAVVNKAGAVQSVINVTYPVDLKPNSDDAIKAKVMNTILGAGFSSRLFVNLREKHGYTYGSYSSLNNDELVAEFSAYAKVRNAVTDSSVTEIMNELNRIRTEKVSQEELEGIKNYLTGNFAISLEDPATIARFAINTERYKLPKDYYANYLKNLAAVTSDDVYAMAQKYIRPENATILVVGNKEEVSPKLIRFSPSNKVEYYDNFGKPVAAVAKPVPAGITAKTVIADYVKAIGGAKALMKIKDVSTVMSTKVQGMDIKVITSQKPNKYAMSVKMGEMVLQKQVYDGKVGKQSSMQGKKDLEGADLDDIKSQAVINPEMNYEKMGYKLNLKGIEEINGKDAYILEVTSPKGKTSTEWYDVESKLKVRASQTTNSEAGPVTSTTDILEYKEVDGVKFPSVISITGAMSMKLKAESININKGIQDSEFTIQ
ncbi:MAG: insulinase family protein [Bacteroidia bacterium]